jgi:uncharacterized protein YecE (DUF72 family)
VRHPGSRAAQCSGEVAHLTGRLLVGTSGFAYRDWIPRFYPAGTRPSDLLAAYAARLGALELNATFRRRPSPAAVTGWMRATPPSFRFAVKAQRGAAVRALLGTPQESVAWLTQPLDGFGERLGAVLLRVPAEIRRDGPWAGRDPAEADRRLAAVLAAWPPAVPLAVELQDPSWHVDETFSALRGVGAALCVTELDDHATPPTVRQTGPFLYLRLRRSDYAEAELRAWAARIEPFIGAGSDVMAFFRHDPVGRAAELALRLEEAVSRL